MYIADVYTAIALLASNRWSNSILQSDAAKSSTTLQVPFTIGKWVFTGCIILSFLLLLWEARKARAIIKSRDISYAFTNVMSQDYYSMRSYDHFCFFTQINDSKKKKDEFAFFIFFTFKGVSFLPTLTMLTRRRMEASPARRCTASSHQRHHALLFWRVRGLVHRLLPLLRRLDTQGGHHHHHALHARHLGRIRDPSLGRRVHVCSPAVLHPGEPQGVLLPQGRQTVSRSVLSPMQD